MISEDELNQRLETIADNFNTIMEFQSQITLKMVEFANRIERLETAQE